MSDTGILKAKVNGVWVPVSSGSSSSGGGSDVHVGPEVPVGAEELWYDTDAVGLTQNQQWWNASWGIVAKGSFVTPQAPYPYSGADLALTTPLVITTVVGRRYRIKFHIRAMSNTAGAGSISFFLWDYSTNLRGSPWGDPYVWVAGAYSMANCEWLLDGDGVQHSYTVHATGIAANLYLDSGHYYIEDVGPGIGPPISVQEPPPPWNYPSLVSPWQNYTGAGRSVTSYRRRGDMVDLRMSVNGGTVGSNILNLPVGFRPPGVLDLAGRDGGAGYLALFNIDYTGDVRWYGPGTSAPPVALTASFSVTP